MLRSQNGWSVLDEPPPSVEVVPGVKLSLRPGDCAFLLVRTARWIHVNVEPLNTPVVEGGVLLRTDDWGWAKRNVRGSTTTISNHASGTAEDLNATEHPRGVKRTWTAPEIAKIDAHLKEYEGTVRWGEHYSTTVDGMHFEINADESEVARVADKLRALDARRANVNKGDVEMFVASYGVDFYVVGVSGKRKVTKTAADELRNEAKLPYVGTLSAATLSEFPTFSEANSTVGGNTAAMVTDTYNGVKTLLARAPKDPA